MIGLTAVANIVFQVEVLIYADPAYGLRLAVTAIVGLIMVVGSRITPSITRNWLTRQGSKKDPIAKNWTIFASDASLLARAKE